jgi:hypothetical protein
MNKEENKIYRREWAREKAQKVKEKYGLSMLQIQKYGFKLSLEVYEKYNRKCSMCENENNLQIHHKDHSGQTDNPNNGIENLQLVCLKCHSSISSKKRWKEHFDNGGVRYTGREKEYAKEYMSKNYAKMRKRKTDWQRNYNRKHRDEYNARQKELRKIRKENNEVRAAD